MAREYSLAYYFLATSYHLLLILPTGWLVTPCPRCQDLGGERGCGRVVGWGAWVRPAGRGRFAGAPRRRGCRRQQPPRPLGRRPHLQQRPLRPRGGQQAGWEGGARGEGRRHGKRREEGAEGRRSGSEQRGAKVGRRRKEEWGGQQMEGSGWEQRKGRGRGGDYAPSKHASPLFCTIRQHMQCARDRGAIHCTRAAGKRGKNSSRASRQ